MDNFNSFFQTLSRGKSGTDMADGPPATATAPAPAPAPAPSPFTFSSTSTTTTTVVRSSAASPSLSTSSATAAASTVGEGEGASGTIAGLEVSQPAFTFSTPANKDLPHPQCTPIAFYNSDAPYGSGRLIAVSDSYICYAIKDGHIRGINRQSVQRTLLKGHKKPVIDLAFARRNTTTLASLGGDGSFYLWTISEAPGDKTLTSVPLLAVTNVHLQRVVWHPTKPHTIAVVAPNGEVGLVNTQHLIEKLGGRPGGPAPTLAATQGLKDLQPEWSISAATNKCLDLSFSQDGKYLVTAGADGWARVWDVESRQAMGRWQPYGGEPVTRALFLHRSKGSSSGEKVFVVTGGKQDSEIKLFRAWTTLSPINTQTLTFAPPMPDSDVGKGGRAFHLEADESGEFLLLADSLRPLLYVAHVVLGPSTAKVDRLTPFQLKHPVLSLIPLSGIAMDAHEGQADRGGASEVQLYCVQTQAIQIYHVRPEECTTGPVVGGGTPASPPPLPTSTAAAPPASEAPQPAILQMLLQASQAAGNTAAPAPPARTTPGLISPQSIAAAGGGGSGGGGPREDEASTQSVAAALSEEKQTGGAHTTEVKGEAGGSTSSGNLSGLLGRTSSAPRFNTGGAGEESSGVGGGSASGQASRDAAGGSVTAPPPLPTLPPPSSSSAPVGAASGGGGGGGAGASADVIARLDAMEDRLGRLVVTSTKQAVADAMGGLEKKLEKALKAAVTAQLATVPAQVAAGVGAAVKEPVSTSFKQCFQEMLIPAMQTTTQKMFAQMTEALNKNMAAAQKSGAGGAGAGGAFSAGLADVKIEVTQVRADVASVVRAVGALSTQLETLAHRLDGGDTEFAGGLGARRGNATAASAAAKKVLSPPSNAPVSLKEELRAELRAGRFNEAFQRALGASDLDLVTWVCSEAPKDDIFDSDPPLLSQTILLCLMQQLTFHLGRETGTKLEWLKQLTLAFNSADPEVAPFVGSVLSQLTNNLDTGAAEVAALGDQQHIRDFKFVQRAIRGMVR